MKSVFSRVFSVFWILIILFFGLKGCVGTVYRVNKIQVFQNITKHGETRKIYLTPKNKLIISREYRDSFDDALFEIKGVSITHYFGSLYNSGESIFSLKVYKNIIEAYKIELTLLKNIGNIEESSFEEVGNRSIHYLLFRDKSIEFDGQHFNKIELDNSDSDFIDSFTKAN